MTSVYTSSGLSIELYKRTATKKDNPILTLEGTPLCPNIGAANTNDAIRTNINKKYSKFFKSNETSTIYFPKLKQYKLILNSEDAKFNGPETDRPTVYKATKTPCDGRKYSIAYTLAPYGVAVFKF